MADGHTHLTPMRIRVTLGTSTAGHFATSPRPAPGIVLSQPAAFAREKSSRPPAAQRHCAGPRIGLHGVHRHFWPPEKAGNNVPRHLPVPEKAGNDVPRYFPVPRMAGNDVPSHFLLPKLAGNNVPCHLAAPEEAGNDVPRQFPAPKKAGNDTLFLQLQSVNQQTTKSGEQHGR